MTNASLPFLMKINASLRGLVVFRRDRKGAVAMEAGFVLPIYIVFTLFLFKLSTSFFFQEILDHATAAAARTIQVGSSQAQATSSASFVQAILCPNLNGLMNCNQIQVNVAPVTNFYSTAVYTPPRKKDGTLDTSQMTYCNGTPGQLMLVHALYSAPFSLWPLSSGVNGNTIIMSTAAFQNELYPASGGSSC